MKKSVSIIGFGRFGKTLYRLLKDDFTVMLFNRHKEVFDEIELTPDTKIAASIEDIYTNDVIFFAVPIAQFEQVIKTNRKYFKPHHLLVDVLSVKIHAQKIFEKYIKNSQTRALLTHPLFGPDSSKNGFAGLPLIMNRFTTNKNEYEYWKSFFSKKGIRVIEMTAKMHDQLAANSQGVTHFVGRLLEEFGFTKTAIDTLGAQKLHEVKDQTCNDTWELFSNLQTFNPYTKKMRVKLGKAYDHLYNKLLPKNISRHYLVFGIQGGKGSFNEEALHFYVKNHGIKSFRTRYLFTTEKVLRNLHQGNIDFGLFAIHNAIGGVVSESTHAMSRYNFKIIEEFAIPVKHFLMKRKDTLTKDVNTIMAHPQVFRQCSHTIKRKYPLLIQKSGTGDFVDTARAAWALSCGKIQKNTAILGPKGMAALFDLEIIDENLQDDPDNVTSFFLVRR